MSEQNPNMNNPRTPGIEANLTPKTGVLGSHPIGTGVGAVATGAAAGAAGGMVAGPVGAVAGAVVGAVAGAVVGKAAAEVVNPTIEAKFWRETYASRPYANAGFSYEEYAPAYRYGWETFGTRGAQAGTFESVEADMNRGWDKVKGTSRLNWDRAKDASRDAWNRVQLAAKGPTVRIAN